MSFRIIGAVDNKRHGASGAAISARTLRRRTWRRCGAQGRRVKQRSEASRRSRSRASQYQTDSSTYSKVFPRDSRWVPRRKGLIVSLVALVLCVALMTILLAVGRYLIWWWPADVSNSHGKPQWGIRRRCPRELSLGGLDVRARVEPFTQ